MERNGRTYRIERWLAFILSLLFFLPLVARAEEVVKLSDVGSPELLIKTSQPGLYLSAPAVSTDIRFDVHGVVGRGTVHQRFTNPTDHCVEALYALPLPENAAVDSLKMTIGNRTIDGEIKERAEAKAAYEEAKSNGQAASLLEQERPNLFTISVASIGAGETVDITIGFGEAIDYDSGAFSLRFPLAIGPRYDTTATAPQQAVNTGTAAPAAHPTAPFSFVRADRKRSPVTIEATIDAGLPLREVTSSTHKIDAQLLGATSWRITTKEIAPDRDFELRWTPQLGAMPKAAVFTENRTDARYAMMMLFPPDTSTQPAAIVPRETIFIIDTSGSMEGTSIQQAKRALTMAVDRLRGSDSFNIIEFNAHATRFSNASVPADRDHIARAKQWITDLQIQGGTEMLPALELALGDQPLTNDVVRQVIFMTDGQVSNETELFDYIRQHLGNSRLFTVGIGAAPNSYFMRNAARYGRGTFTYVGNVDELASKMTTLFAKLESPTLTNVELALEHTNDEAFPPRIGDLYAGEPLVVTVRLPHGNGKLALRGRLGTAAWEDSLAASGNAVASEASGIAQLWAKEKIESLIDNAGPSQADAVKKDVTQLALAHHLVTDYTSLVAVDTTPKGVNPATCTSERIPLNLPDGWAGGAGSLPQTATNAKLLILIGVLLLLGALAVRNV